MSQFYQRLRGWRTEVDDVGHPSLPPGRFVSRFTQTGVGDLTVSGACLHGTRRRLPWSQLSINIR